MSPFLNVPVVSISGHKKMRGVTNVMLDHDHSAALSLMRFSISTISAIATLPL